MSNKDIPAWCYKAVDSVLDDLSDRRGIGSELSQIDEDVMDEIKGTMASIIHEAALAELEKRNG